MKRIQDVAKEKWLLPIISSPRPTIAGLAVIVALFLPRYSHEISAVAAAIGLMLAAQAKAPRKRGKRTS